MNRNGSPSGDDVMYAKELIDSKVAFREHPWKRPLDVVLALVLLVVNGPLFVVCLLAVRFTSRGPALHWSKRVGKGGKTFLMPKFRTMMLETPQVATHLLAEPERYLTRVGLLLRKTSLDELPQLISVLRGHLSLVGPRPALFNQDDLIALREEYGVQQMLPGITGWAQVNGRDHMGISQKVWFDVEYMRSQSLQMDIRIIMMTALKVLTREGILH